MYLDSGNVAIKTSCGRTLDISSKKTKRTVAPTCFDCVCGTTAVWRHPNFRGLRERR